MNIQIQRNGTWQKISKQELLELVSAGVVRPDTTVLYNDQQIVAARLKGLVFPSQQVAVPPIQPNSDALSPCLTAQAETGQFGKALASGKGKESSVVFTTWVIVLPIVVLNLVVFCAILPSRIEGDERVRWNWRSPSDLIFRQIHAEIIDNEVSEQAARAAFAFWGGIIASLGITLYTVFHVWGIAKTEIVVYENGITGVGCGKYFDANFDLHSFQLTHDKITVDTTKSAIIVHSSGAQYKCYVANPAEIQKVIVNQQQKLST